MRLYFNLHQPLFRNKNPQKIIETAEGLFHVLFYSRILSIRKWILISSFEFKGINAELSRKLIWRLTCREISRLRWSMMCLLSFNSRENLKFAKNSRKGDNKRLIDHKNYKWSNNKLHEHYNFVKKHSYNSKSGLILKIEASVSKMRFSLYRKIHLHLMGGQMTILYILKML